MTAAPASEPLLSTLDCVCELLFGLFMALTFVGAISVVNPGNGQVREMFIGAFGCNIAWGLVDAVMYLVRTVTDRGRWLTLKHGKHAGSNRPRPRLGRRDLLAALAIFAIVVASTIPVVLPFVLIADLRIAKHVSHAIALAMLFGGGAVLGRHAGYGPLRVGGMVAGLGTVMVVAINALGG